MCLKPIHKILNYGKGGVGKSSFAADVAAYVWKKYGKKTRVVTADGGGEKAYQPLMDEGIVSVWAIDSFPEASIFHNLNMATKGHWPANVAEPDSPLLAPTKVWKPCPSCKGDSGSIGQAQVVKCQACGIPFAQGVRLEKVTEAANGFDEVGAYVFEGATSFGQLMLNRLRLIDSGGGRQVKDGDFTIAGLGKQHYGDAQNYAAIQVANTHTIPVPIVLWTALELRGVDDDGKPAYGPAFPGKALLERCLPWFTDVIHTDLVPRLDANKQSVKDGQGIEIVDRKLYVAPHFPADCKPYGFFAKCSAPRGGEFPKVLDFPEVGGVATTFFQKMDEARVKAKAALLA